MKEMSTIFSTAQTKTWKSMDKTKKEKHTEM